MRSCYPASGLILSPAHFHRVKAPPVKDTKKLVYLTPWGAAVPNALDADLGAGVADKTGVGGKQVVPEQSPQDRVDFLLSEVARGSEDYEGMGRVLRFVSLFLNVSQRLPKELQTLGVAQLKGHLPLRRHYLRGVFVSGKWRGVTTWQRSQVECDAGLFDSRLLKSSHKHSR